MKIVINEQSPFPGVHSWKIVNLVFNQRERAALSQAAKVAEVAREKLRLLESQYDWEGDPFNEDVDMDLFHVSEARDMISGFVLRIPE